MQLARRKKNILQNNMFVGSYAACFKTNMKYAIKNALEMKNAAPAYVMYPGYTRTITISKLYSK